MSWLNDAISQAEHAIHNNEDARRLVDNVTEQITEHRQNIADVTKEVLEQAGKAVKGSVPPESIQSARVVMQVSRHPTFQTGIF
jgi:3-oxoacyl-ACP reductase-like protein